MPDAPDDPAAGDGGDREVVVPVELYKVVTVFSTVIAVVFVVLGFTMFGAATSGSNPLRLALAWVAGQAGVGLDGDLVALGFAVLGFAFVGAGAGVYLLGTRFRTEGMGTSKTEGDRGSDNG